MSKQTFHFKCYIASLSILCLIIFSACDNPENNTTQSDISSKTQVEFTNLEQYSATIYSDPARLNIITQVDALSIATVPTIPAPFGTAFYPTFHFSFKIGTTEIIIPFNGPAIIAAIETDKTNLVRIPELETIEIDSSYIFLINNSNFSLTLREGNIEKSPFGDGTSIINSGLNAVYEIPPGSGSGYSLRRNTTDPIAFPADLTEFRQGIIYIFTYNGTDLTIEEKLIRQVFFPPPATPKIAAITESSISLEWNALGRADGYNVYRSADENENYSRINSEAITGTIFTDTGLDAYTNYYYKLGAIYKKGIEEIQENPVSASTGIIISGNSFAAKLDWLKNNASNNFLYLIEIDADESVVPQTLSYSGKSGITIILRGNETVCTLTLSASGSLLTIGSGVTLILDNNITLNGRNANSNSLVSISGGTLIINEGCKITGNSSSFLGGGVYVSSGTFYMSGGEISNNSSNSSSSGGVFVGSSGTFYMSGGEISNNSSSSLGGGVYVNSGTFYMSGGEISNNSSSLSGGGVFVGSGTFYMSGGIIYGSNASINLRNTVSSGGGAAFYKLGGTVQYGTFSGDTFIKSGDLTTTDATIRIVNGNLLTE